MMRARSRHSPRNNGTSPLLFPKTLWLWLSSWWCYSWSLPVVEARLHNPHVSVSSSLSSPKNTTMTSTASSSSDVATTTTNTASSSSSSSSAAAAAPPPPPTTTTTTTTSSSSSVIWRFPLHQVSGTQHINVYVGQPPVRQTWIVDTGSRFTATVCGALCYNCGHHTVNDVQVYQLNDSFTHRLTACSNGGSSSSSSSSSTTPEFSSPSCQMTQECGRFLGHHQTLLAEKANTLACKVHQQYTEGSSWTAWEVNDIVVVEGAERVIVNKNENDVASAGLDHHRQGKNDATISATGTDTDDNNIVWDLAVPLSFGCQTELRGLFRKQYADGILGLERSSYNWIHELHRQGVIVRNAFRLCLHPQGGWMSVGHDDITSTPDMKFTPSPSANQRFGGLGITTTTTLIKKWYNVQVQAVWLGDELLANNVNLHPEILASFTKGKATILDSGTTDTFLPSALFQVFAPAWERQTGLPYNNNNNINNNNQAQTYDYTFAEFQRLPEIHLKLANNVTWTIYPKYYMDTVPLSSSLSNKGAAREDGVVVQPWSGRKRLTNRIYVDEPTGAVLGLNAMMGYEIEFSAHGVGVMPSPNHCY